MESIECVTDDCLSRNRRLEHSILCDALEPVAKFYAALGFISLPSDSPENPVAVLDCSGLRLIVRRGDAMPGAQSMSLSFVVDDLRAKLKAVIMNGGGIAAPIRSIADGERVDVTDPVGTRLVLTQFALATSKSEVESDDDSWQQPAGIDDDDFKRLNKGTTIVAIGVAAIFACVASAVVVVYLSDGSQQRFMEGIADVSVFVTVGLGSLVAVVGKLLCRPKPSAGYFFSLDLAVVVETAGLFVFGRLIRVKDGDVASLCIAVFAIAMILGSVCFLWFLGSFAQSAVKLEFLARTRSCFFWFRFVVILFPIAFITAGLFTNGNRVAIYYAMYLPILATAVWLTYYVLTLLKFSAMKRDDAGAPSVHPLFTRS